MRLVLVKSSARQPHTAMKTPMPSKTLAIKSRLAFNQYLIFVIIVYFFCCHENEISCG
jgi:hypothetical protein